MIITHYIARRLTWMLLACSCAGSLFAQEVFIPDPAMKAAIRESLQKPAGPLTEQDLLTLIRLNACCRGITNVDGIQFARNLVDLDLGENQLASFTLPPGMTSLISVDLDANQMTSVTLPPDATNLTSIFVDGNPINTFVLSEALATNGLSTTVAALERRGVQVFTYPDVPRLFRLRLPIGAFQFALTGPPGAYSVLGSSDLTTWTEVGITTNTLGTLVFTDTTAHLSTNKFYRALLLP